ncbi:hypothetical protein DFH06DRAFT_1319737 [Mycena polygramma]|nr:hypothetical protein DFH06DRAFT_1319737 [Mycena polygramma]
MPKAAKTPPKPRPKPKPLVKSPKKNISTPKFISDEAEESDDGVLVDRPAGDGDDDEEFDTMQDHEYESDFINDGDIYEEVSDERSPSITPPPSSPVKSPAKSQRAKPSRVEPDSDSPEVTPPPSPVKAARGRASRVVKDELTPPPTVRSKQPQTPKRSQKSAPKAVAAEEVIELESSDEDLTAMDVDDSVFKKPTGIKHSALPPSLLTRSAASKLGIKVAPVTELDEHSAERSDDKPPVSASADAADTVPSVAPASAAPFQIPANMDPAMSLCVILPTHYCLIADMYCSALTAWMESYMAGRAADPTPVEKRKARVDHDEIALKAAIESSIKRLESPPQKLRSLSPEDWDPPFAGDVASSSRPSSPSKVGKGKGKARYRSPPPQSESSPGKRKKAVAVESDAEGTKPTAGKSGVASTSKRVKREGGEQKGDLSSYLIKSEPPAISADGGASAGSPPLTMAQYMRVANGEKPSDVKGAPSRENSPEEDVDTVFLEDLEVYKAYFNPKAPCGVYDLDLQDLSLRDSYKGLHPLPGGRRIVPSYDRTRNSVEDIDYTTGGRVRYSSWFTQNPRMLAANSMNAMLFERSEPNFINPSRISPLELGCKVSAGSVTTHRLYVGDRIAICVSAVCCMESHVVTPKRVGARSERLRKWFNGVFHDQDWERWEAILCLVFHERIMYGQFVDKAVSFQTMISPDPRNAQDSPPDRNTRGVPASMFSSRTPSKKTPTKTSTSVSRGPAPVKTLLAYNDPIPVYDARKTVIDFESDLERLDQVLPLFPGEIPSGSFTIVGYTVASYMATISGGSDRLPHIGCNILWAIVCGTPSPSSSA